MATVYSEAKKKKFDEYYTQYEYIQKEINAYLEFNPNTFRNKTILLPCDDPEWSNFTKFFAQNFETLGLKKLISTSFSLEQKKSKYENFEQITLFELNSPNYDEKKSTTKGRIFTLTSDSDNSGNVDIDDLNWDYLDGDGDFRSEEVKKLRAEADIIVTNPPFSLFREFISWLFEEPKQFLIIGNIGNVTYNDIFPLFQNNKMWLGATCDGSDMVFRVPEGTEISISDREKAERLGYKGSYTRMGNTVWYTNLDHGKRHRALDLMTMKDNLKFCKYAEIRNNGYVKYDNYDAIEVKYTMAIPL